MIEAADKKRELILDKALLRFAHFGINKTTMNDIAEDLAISKPSLYYYFPDKISLVIAVAERIFNEFFTRLEHIILKSATVQEALNETIELRKIFFKKYFMLHIGDTPSDMNLNHEGIKALMQQTREKENLLIKDLFETGIKRGELIANESAQVAELYMDSIIGLGMCVMGKQEKQLMPESKGFEEVLMKQKALTEIFLNGLKN